MTVLKMTFMLVVIACQCAAFSIIRPSSSVVKDDIFRRRSLLSSSIDGEVDENTDMMDSLSDDELLIQRVMNEVMAESGVELDQLINPSKVVNLERDLLKLRAELETCMDSNRVVEINEEVGRKEKTLSTEKRSVMRGWLKGLFVGQSVLAGAISLAMVYDAIPGQDLPLPLRVLGFWSWWLFIIPSLRARKPSYAEKEALNIAFLASPAVSILMPTFTKDVTIIWWANLATVAVCYAYAFTNEGKKVDDEVRAKSVLPKAVTQALNALDYGSGKERGVRK